MKFNLQKRRHKGSDYVYHKSFKLGATPLPDQLLFLSDILDQGALDECTAYSSVAVRQNEMNKVYDPVLFWANEMAFAGNNGQNGYDIQVPLATGVEKGFPPTGDNASAYFWIHENNGLDFFDSCRTAMQQQNRPLLGGVEWMSEWTGNATIDSLGKSPEGGHCIKISGWKQINGQPYMVLQNSWGMNHGDGGLYYMSRFVFNEVFGQGFGVAIWSDTTDITIKTLGRIMALYQNILTLLLG